MADFLVPDGNYEMQLRSFIFPALDYQSATEGAHTFSHGSQAKTADSCSFSPIVFLKIETFAVIG